MPASIRAVAARAGIGRTAVSLALRGLPGVSAHTRRRVLAAAQAVGYRADPLAARLAARRWRQRIDAPRLVVLVDESAGRPGRPAAVEALAEAARAGGFSPLLVEVRRRPDVASLSRRLLSQGAVALIAAAPAASAALVGLPWARVAAASLGDGEDLGLHQVLPDWPLALERARRELTVRGCRRIGCVTLIGIGAATRRLLDPSLSAAATPGIPVLTLDPRSPEPLRRWRLRHRVDAVIGFNTAVYWRLRWGATRLPDGLRFVSLQRPAYPHRVRCAHLAVPAEAIASAAVQLCVDELRSGRRGIARDRRTVLIAPAWVPGELDADVSASG